MLVLGVGGFLHDYNCALVDVKSGKVAMCEAERQSRRKHHVIASRDEIMAPIEQCCRDLGRRVKDVEVLVLAHTDPFEAKDWLKSRFAKARVVELDHHLSHAAGAFFTSPFESALVLSLDGFGDGCSGLMASGSGLRLEELERTGEDDSIGLEYLRATVHLGLGGYGSEGKTQGLAPYGEPSAFDDYMQEIEITPSGGTRLSPRLRQTGSRLAEEGGYLNTQLLTNEFLGLYGPKRIPPEPINAEHRNLASSIQKVIEHVAAEMCRIGKRRTGAERLVLGGGVCMNSSMNGHLMREGGFRNVYALPMSSDRGTGIGAALYHAHHDLGVPRFFSLDHLFFGGESDEREAIKAAKKAGLKPERTKDLPGEAAAALADGKIIGWFQGRSEMGARALGHRSILADPRIAEMKDTINEKVKHREWFRPFAPSVLAGRAREYFDFPEGVSDLSFMTYTVPAKREAREKAPATVHVDGTARVQTVEEGTNPLYAELIERFCDLTGVPVLLNTSFNDSGEPIVESPGDAVRTFLRTDMDTLFMGKVVCRKK